MTAASVTQYKEDTMSEINDEMVTKMLEGTGYVLEDVKPLRGEFVAIARKTLANGEQSFTVEALGRTPQLAAHAVVKSIMRP